MTVCRKRSPAAPSGLNSFILSKGGANQPKGGRDDSNLKVVKGAWYAKSTLLEDVGIDHGGRHIAMSHQSLNRADVGATLEQVGSKGMRNVCALMLLVSPTRRALTLMALLITLGST